MITINTVYHIYIFYPEIKLYNFHKKLCVKNIKSKHHYYSGFLTINNKY